MLFGPVQRLKTRPKIAFGWPAPSAAPDIGRLFANVTNNFITITSPTGPDTQRWTEEDP
ncbi:hypothetical protein DBB_3990 [Desulfoluna spongiiphila]|nr:hypothetical protein DBB_3990 [Desulfoluna spongiiphila]